MAHRPLPRVVQQRQRRPGVLVDEVLDVFGGVGRALDQHGGGLDLVEDGVQVVGRRGRQVADAEDAAQRVGHANLRSRRSGR